MTMAEPQENIVHQFKYWIEKLDNKKTHDKAGTLLKCRELLKQFSWYEWNILAELAKTYTRSQAKKALGCGLREPAYSKFLIQSSEMRVQEL